MFEIKRTGRGQPQSNGEHCEPRANVGDMEVPRLLPVEATRPAACGLEGAARVAASDHFFVPPWDESGELERGFFSPS